MKIHRRVVFGILLAALLFFTAFLLRDFLLENFVKPIALLLWSGNRLIASIDQSTYWAGLILVLICFSLLRFLRRNVIQEVEHAENGNATLDRIRYWRTLILLTTHQSGRFNFLKNALQKLMKDIYAAKQSSQAPWKIHQDIEQGDMLLPDSISAFLLLGPSNNAPPNSMQRLQRLLQAPTRQVRHWQKQDEAEYYQSIDEVISFMEKELEKDDDQ
jgi:hypothetical protein